MVIVHFSGGLGNQFFQYAAGRAIAVRHHVPLKFALTELNADHKRKFEIPQFHTTGEIARPEEIQALLPAGTLHKIWMYCRPKPVRTYHREKRFYYEPGFEKIGPAVYLKGLFQSEKYFQEIIPLIREELRPHSSLIEKVQAFGMNLNQHHSVAIHIRRGDYMDPATRAFHGVLDEHYYNQAIAAIRESVTEPVFYIFSDDIDWVRENLQLPNTTVVSGNISHTHYEDLWLMSQCRHQIIANSSFSWWAAWLNRYQQKSVIAPLRWFNEAPFDTKDLIPSGWIRI